MPVKKALAIYGGSSDAGPNSRARGDAEAEEDDQQNAGVTEAGKREGGDAQDVEVDVDVDVERFPGLDDA